MPFKYLFCQNENFPLKSYSVSNNFITDNIYSVFRDTKGMMWYGTESGVLQFDGTVFKLFTTQDGLPDNEVFNFCEDYKGRIWFAAFNGNIGYYFQGQLFNELNDTALKVKEHKAYVSLIEVQKDSSILFLYFNSNEFLEIKGNQKSLIRPVYDFEKFGNIRYITKSGIGEYSAFTDKAKLYFLGTKLIKVDKFQNLRTMFYNSRVYSLKSDSLFAVEKGNLIYLRKIQKREPSIYNYFMDKNGYLFEGTDEGLYIYNKTSSEPILHILKDCKVSSINTDIEGNYWVSTLNKGVYQFSRGFQEIRYNKYGDLAKINSFIVLGGKLYLLTEDNRIYLVSERDKPSLFYDFDGIVGKTGRNVRFQVAASDNNIVLGSNETILIEVKHGKPVLHDVFKKVVNYKKDIQVDGNIFYWHNNDTIYQVFYEYKKLRVDRFAAPDRQRIFDLCLNEHKLWASTRKSIFMLTKHGLEKVKSFRDLSFRKFNFFNGKFIGITQDYKLVIGQQIGATLDFKLQIIQEKCIWIDMNYIFNGNVLMRSDKGYYVLNIERDTAILNPTENALLPNFPQQIACDSPFVYFLSTENGLTRIHNKTILSVSYPPNAIIKAFTASGKFFNFEKIINLTKKEASSIVIEFTGIGFNRKKISYKYRMNNGEWVTIEENRINLLNSEPGTYLMEIRSKSDSSGFSKPAFVHFVIDPPWYRTWVFLLFACLVILGIFWVILKYLIRRNSRLKELKFQDEMRFMQAEFKALNALMNPHFIFNSLNNIQHLINENNKTSANQYLSVFSKLVRQNMENINQDLIGLDRELNLVENYLQLEKLRFKEKLTYHIHVEHDIEISTIKVPPLLIQPLVENAIKHGIMLKDDSTGTIEIAIKEYDNSLIISVTDDGGGFAQTLQNKGLNMSLKNIENRLRQLEKIHNMNFHLALLELKNDAGKILGAESRIQIHY